MISPGDVVECVTPDYRNVLTKGEQYTVKECITLFGGKVEILLEGLPYFLWMPERFKKIENNA